LLTDVGLVSVPDAGKSTLLRTSTGGRARHIITGYVFTALNPVVGVVHIAEDGWSLVGGGEDGAAVYDETSVERECKHKLTESGTYVNVPTCDQGSCKQDTQRHTETFRFTITNNSGLIEDVLENSQDNSQEMRATRDIIAWP
jgi:hypothetical protein